MSKAQNQTLRAFQAFDGSVAPSASTPKVEAVSHRNVAPAKQPAPASKPKTPRRARAKARETVPCLSATEQRLGRHLVIALSAVVVIMLGVSLKHLASGIREITHSTAWSAWALAVAIDIGMVASEVALIAMATFPNIRVADYAHRYVSSTIAISIVLNIWAFWPPGANSALASRVLAVILGAGIPLGVYHLTRVAGQIWLAASNRMAPE